MRSEGHLGEGWPHELQSQQVQLPPRGHWRVACGVCVAGKQPQHARDAQRH